MATFISHIFFPFSSLFWLCVYYFPFCVDAFIYFSNSPGSFLVSPSFSFWKENGNDGHRSDKENRGDVKMKRREKKKEEIGD